MTVRRGSVDGANGGWRTFRRTSLAHILENYYGNLDERHARQSGLLEQLLKAAPCERVLDLALGSAVDAIALAQAGAEVTGNEIDPDFEQLALKRLACMGLTLPIRHTDWREMATCDHYESAEFGLAYALGNSFPTYVCDREAQLVCLDGFHRLLCPGGWLVFDSRNYDYVLDEWQDIVQDPLGCYRYNGRSTFLASESVRAFPYHLSGANVHFAWVDAKARSYSTLQLVAVRRADIESLLLQAGFLNIRVLYDYGLSTSQDYDFIQFVARKPMQ